VLSSYEKSMKVGESQLNFFSLFQQQILTAHLHTSQQFLSPVNCVLLEGLGHRGSFRRYKIKSVQNMSKCFFFNFLACLDKEKKYKVSACYFENTKDCSVSRICFCFPCLSLVDFLQCTVIHSWPTHTKIFRRLSE
jgi:hypothetical protein